MKRKYILALDQGTTSSRAILFNQEQQMIGCSQKEIPQTYPQAGWVEQDPIDIYASQYGVLTDLLLRSNVDPSEIAGIGITNQRETTIVWNRHTGKPVYPAIVWQCRRTADICTKLRRSSLAGYIQEATGLLPDAYFSAAKIQWILDHVPAARKQAEQGDLLFGTVDSWLIWQLTGGKVHATDYTNASRTMLFNLHTLKWDSKICEALHIPLAMLPEVRSSSEFYGYASISGKDIPITGVAGDQQAALFGQTCFEPGEAKNTYGTGCFLLMNTGKQMHRSEHGLLTTIGIGLKDHLCYALEGSVFTAGAVVQWLRDEMRFIVEAKDVEYYAQSVPDNGGVYIVPAFTGLGAPHWDMYARGGIFGITRGTKRAHIIRAAEESIAYQTYDLLCALEADTGLHLSQLKADGGAARDLFLVQFQADIINRPVVRPAIQETTALGAAYLAGLAVGYWKDLADLNDRRQPDTLCSPAMQDDQRNRLLKKWRQAVSRCLEWETEESAGD